MEENIDSCSAVTDKNDQTSFASEGEGICDDKAEVDVQIVCNDRMCDDKAEADVQIICDDIKTDQVEVLVDGLEKLSVQVPQKDNTDEVQIVGLTNIMDKKEFVDQSASPKNDINLGLFDRMSLSEPQKNGAILKNPEMLEENIEKLQQKTGKEDMERESIPAAVEINRTSGLDIKVPPSLQDYESYFNWMHLLTVRKPFTFEDAETIQRVIHDKFIDTPFDAEDTSLKFNGMEIISNKATQAFCNLIINKLDEGKIHIAEATDLINRVSEQDIIGKEYLSGFEYVIRGLHMFYLFLKMAENDNQNHNEMKNQLALLVATSESFTEISVKGQIGVKAMKFFFIGQLRDKGNKQVEILQEIISQEDCHYWYYQLYYMYRIQRRENHCRSEPDEQEQSMIQKAAELSPDDPLINLGLCQCLLEIFKNRKSSNAWDNGGINFGTIGTFKSPDEVVDFIKEKTNKVLELHGSSIRVNVAIAEIFSVSIPYPHRDNAFAKKCITRAIELAPNSSKANHRMGIFSLTSENNEIEALKYFEKAVESDPRNFPALSDVIQTNMSHPMRNSDKLQRLFKCSLENSIWTESKHANLLWLNGIFMIMKGDKKGAIDSWLEVFKNNQSSTLKNFDNLEYYRKRYKWNSNKDVSLDQIRQVLKHALDEHKDRAEQDKDGIRQILLAVDSSIAQASARNSNHDYDPRRSGRGRGFNNYNYRGNPRGRGNNGVFSRANPDRNNQNFNTYQNRVAGATGANSGPNRSGWYKSNTQNPSTTKIREPLPPGNGNGFARGRGGSNN